MRITQKVIKVGVVGCGYWGPNLVRNLKQSSDCHLKLLCDVSEQRLSHMRRLYPDLTTSTNFQDLLNDREIDAVVIATPVRFHYDMAKAAFGFTRSQDRPSLVPASLMSKALRTSAPPESSMIGVAVNAASTGLTVTCIRSRS